MLDRGLEPFAFDCALQAAWRTEFWLPGDPDYGFVDYFEAAAARNLGLLAGVGELAEYVERRGIIPDTHSDQARLVTDGGTSTNGTDRDYPCGRNPLDIADVWAEQAAENVDEWGEQSIETLLLAIQEELGELTQATLECRAEGGDYAPLFDELDDLGALLFQLHGAINAHRFEREPRSVDTDGDRQ